MNNMWYLNFGLVCYVAFFLILWFNSDIVETVAKLTWTKKLFRIEEFHTYKMEVDAMAEYPDFLIGQYRGWITMLLSCPVCLTFWSTLIHTCILWPWQAALVLFPINYCLSLSIYLLIRKLL